MRYLVRFDKALGGFVKNGVYLFDDANLRKIPAAVKVDAIPFSQIGPYNGQNNLLIIRSGGMGDIAALSCLCDAAPNVTLISCNVYRHVTELWAKPPKLVDFQKPVFMAKNKATLLSILADYGTLIGEDIIERGGSENWFSIFYKAANQPIGELRPKFKPLDLPKKKGCLIVHLATSVNRSANLIEIVAAASTKFETVVVASMMDWTTRQYIEACASYEYCIAVDTSAVHIREGLGLPTLAIYGAFHKDSRTAGYKYTKSIQLTDYPYVGQDKPRCTPCYKHGKVACQHNAGTNYAPCLTYIADIIAAELPT